MLMYASCSSNAFLLLVHFPDRKSTRLNSSHGYISYAVFCLKKKHTGGGTARALGARGRPARGGQAPLLSVDRRREICDGGISRSGIAPHRRRPALSEQGVP